MYTRFGRMVTLVAALAFAGAAFAQSTTPHAIAFIKPAVGTYHAAAPVGFLVKFSGNVSFTGTPRLSLQVGSATRYADAKWHEAERLYFVYTVADGDQASGISVGSGIDLNGGAITVDGAAADTSFNWPELSASGTFDLSGIAINTTYPPPEAPWIAAATATGPWRYGTRFGFFPAVVGRNITYSATGLPNGLTLYPESGLIAQSEDTVSPLSAVATVTATNAKGSASAWIKFVMSDLQDGWLPATNDVRSIGTPFDGTYHPGDTLTFSLTYPAPVVVFGTPQLELYVGGRSRFAQYVPTDSASDMVFRYTVAADDEDSDGIGLARQFDRTNADVRSAVDGVRLEHGWGIFPDTRQIFISTVPGTPHPVSVLKPASGTYHAGNLVAIGVRFNATGVTFTGQPRLALHVGGATRYAVAFASINDLIAFAYTVDPSDGPASGLTIDSAIDLNGGSISIDHNTASTSLAELGSDGLNFPGVAIDTASASGNTIVHEAVATGPANSAYRFYYDPVVSGPTAPSFSTSGLPSWLQASSTTGALTQASSVTVPATATFTLTADGSRGTTALMKANLVSPNTDALADPYTPMSVGVPVDATYYNGMTLYFSVTYDAGGPLKVIGTPQLNFTIGGQSRSATYLPGYRNDQLVFAYTVAIGDSGVVSLPNHLDGDFFTCTFGGAPNHNGWPYIVDTSHIVASGGSSPRITSMPTATTRVGTVFSYTITASSPPNPTSFDAAPLPDGLTVDRNTGVISGSATTAGTYSIGISATSTAGTANGTLSLTVQPPMAAPVITYPGDTLETWWQWSNPRDNPPSFTVQATDGPATYRATGLPSGVYMTSYGHVEPNPAPPGVYDVTFYATNSVGTGSKQVHWTVYPAVEGAGPYFGTYYEGDTIPFAVGFSGPVVVTGAPTLLFNNGLQLKYLGGSGTRSLSFAVVATPDLFDAGAGIVPTQLNLNGGAIQSPDGLPTKIAFSIHQNAGEPLPGVKIITHPRFTSALTDSATVGASYSYQLKAENWVNKYDAVNLPDGLTFAFDQNALTGTISGTPRTAGTYTIALKAWNQFYTDPATATLVLTVGAAGSPPPPPPPPRESAQTITFAQVTSATVGQPLTIAVTASSGLPVSLSLASGNATLSGTTLIINDGNPVVVRGTQSGGNGYAAATADLTLTAGKSTQQIAFVAPPLSVAVGQSVRLQATSSAGLPVALSVLSGPGIMAGDSVTATGLGTITVRATQAGDNAYSAAVADVTIVAVQGDQHLDFSSPVSAIYIGQPVRLGALASSGLPITYAIVSGPATISGDLLTITGAGPVVIRATQPGTDAIAAASAEITVTGTAVPTSRLVNLSSRARVVAGDDNRAFIAGFVVTGTAPKRLLLRAVGPTLTNYQVSGVLTDPRLRLVDTNGRVVAENDNWSGVDVSDSAAHVGAFTLAAGTRDAALVVTLPPGGYTMQILSNGGDGVALAEVYDASDNPTTDGQKLINISTRAYVDTGDNVLIAGFVVSGDTPKRVLIRGIGPTLANYSVTSPLSDPIVTVYHDNVVVARNDNWETGVPTTAGDPAATAAQIAAAATATGAFPLPPGSKDAAVVLTLSPGLYSAIVSGTNGATGNGMVEIYEMPSQ